MKRKLNNEHEENPDIETGIKLVKHQNKLSLFRRDRNPSQKFLRDKSALKERSPFSEIKREHKIQLRGISLLWIFISTGLFEESLKLRLKSCLKRYALSKGARR